MKAVVMAGGEGTRLRPLTCTRPKPMVPVAGRPVMEHTLTLLQSHGCTEVIATLQYLPEAIIGYFADGSEFGISLTYSVEDQPLGTAGSVRQVSGDLKEPFLVMSGDALTDIDLTALMRFHREKGALVTMALARVENPLEYGVVITSKDGRIQRFVEKPGWGEVFSDTVNTGIYVIDPAVFDLMEPDRAYDWSRDIFPRLLAGGAPIYGWVGSGYWCDIGNLEQYLAANQAALTREVKVSIPGEEVAPCVWVGPGASIDPTARIAGPAYIGGQTTVGAYANLGDWAVVAPGSVIEAGSSLKRTVLMESAYLGSNCELRGAVVGQGALLQAGCRAYEGAVIGDGSFVMTGSQIQPGVRIWPGKQVEAGTRLSENLIWGARTNARLFGACGIEGRINQEITPELAVRIGSAFGSMLKKGEEVAVAHDGTPASQMAARALEAGLTGAGIRVVACESLPLPVARYGIRSSGLAGGIYVRTEETRAALRFLNGQGLDLPPSDERKLENLLAREESRRVRAGEVGTVTHPTHLLPDYVQGLLRSVDADRIRQRRFRIVADFRGSTAERAVGQALTALGCQVLSLTGAAIEDGSAEDGLQGATRLIREIEADLGVGWDPTGERVRLCDDRGVPVTGQQLLTLFTLLVTATEPDCTVVVPVTATRAVDQVVAATGGQVVRTKQAAGTLALTGAERQAAMAGDPRGGFAFPAFQAGMDGCYALLQLLELLTNAAGTLSDLLARLPSTTVDHEALPCPGEVKGLVMRHLIDSCSGRSIQLIDGVKVYDGEDWIAVLPDPVEPVLHLFAEPGGRLLSEYRRRALAAIQKREPHTAVRLVAAAEATL